MILDNLITVKRIKVNIMDKYASEMVDALHDDTK